MIIPAKPNEGEFSTDVFRLEPGSFRDRNGRIFYRERSVFRALDREAFQEWEALSATKFFPHAIAVGKIVQTELVSAIEKAPIPGDWQALLKHEPIPFISYPYEWCFGMLKDAAVLHLDLLQSAMDEDMILKDSSAYNVQWKGARPVLIDIPSFKRLTPGEAWVGYRQFCQMFLYPLFLQAYKNIPFQPWLRGSIDGITPEHCSSFLSLRDLFRPGVFTHVYLQNKFQRQYSQRQTSTRTQLQEAGFSKKLIQVNVNRLAGIIRRLAWKQAKSEWLNYAVDNSYSAADQQTKVAFVRDLVSSRTWKLVWDLGCNTGTFSRIAAENADYVLAMDGDHLAVEYFYRQLKAEENTRILPMLMNLADASPSLGWRGLERKSLTERGKPELTLCLALIHHIVISANIPMREFLDWIAGLGTSLVIEFVTKEDPMVKRLLLNKDDNYADCEIDYFEKCLSQLFDVARREKLASGTRYLYYARAR